MAQTRTREQNMSKDEIDLAIQVLTSIKAIRGRYASGDPGQELTQGMLTVLRGDGKSALCGNIATAIDAANRNKKVVEA